MKKIAVIAHGLSGGGAERVASILANYFAEQGHEVLFVAVYSPERVYELNSKIKYVYLDTKINNGNINMLLRSFMLRKVVKKFGADIAFSLITMELMPLCFSNIPVVPSLRIDPKFLESMPLRWHIRRLVYLKSEKIVFQTKDARDYFEEKICKKGVIIGNPIKPNLPLWDEENHRKVFMTACRITKQKNIPMLINAFVRFHKLHPEYTLELYGDGEPKEYLDNMKDYAKEMGGEEFILFKGHTSEIHSIMCSSEAFFLTSDFEGLSNSMLEAMAVGIPCVCTDCPPGGAGEYIENNKSGILIPVGGEEELFNAMCNIASSSDLRHSLSENSKYVRTVLDKDEICRRWEELI